MGYSGKCRACGRAFVRQSYPPHYQDICTLCEASYADKMVEIATTAIEYSKLKLEQARQRKHRKDVLSRCVSVTCEMAEDLNTDKIDEKCGAALNKMHRLVRNLGE